MPLKQQQQQQPPQEPQQEPQRKPQQEEIYPYTDPYMGIKYGQYMSWSHNILETHKMIKKYKLFYYKSSKPMVFNNDCWGLIKEYAGIYNFKINYDSEKIDYLHAIITNFYTEYNIKNIRKIDILLKEKATNKSYENIYWRRELFVNISKGFYRGWDMKNVYKNLETQLGFPKKRKTIKSK